MIGDRPRETHQRSQGHTARKWHTDSRSGLPVSKGSVNTDTSFYPLLYLWQARLLNHCTDPGNSEPESTLWTTKISASVWCCPALQLPASAGTPHLCHTLNEHSSPRNASWLLQEDTYISWLVQGGVFFLENWWVLCGTKGSWRPPRLGRDPGGRGGGECR